MNTTKLKTFATEARNTLKRGVMNRILALGFDEKGKAVQEPHKFEGGALFMGETVSEDFYNKWQALRSRIVIKGVREVMEEAAYTWFNRFMAIRIMQKNDLIDPVLDYRSETLRLPILLTNAQAGNIPAMPEADRERLMQLLNDPMRTTEQFALLITAFCHNTPIINRCFGKISDYTELLLPNNILEENGFLDSLNNTPFIDEDDYKSPELIGWLYQFYISERKDEVFAKKGKYTPDEIPAATQIFTPNWIVKYMVQNTVGRIYLDNNPYEDELKAKWKYLVENESQDEKLEISDLTELKVADLACGSGHILNECFDLLLDLYVNDGYNRRQAIESIFKNNLTGIDLDTRAKQLATFALLLKACQRDENFKDAHVMPRVYDMSGLIPPRYENLRDTLPHFFLGGNQQIIEETLNAFKLMEQADSLGSIMKFDISPNTRKAIADSMAHWENDGYDDFEGLFAGMKIILALTDDYSALVMNPPYMGGSAMGNPLSKYVKDNYEKGKADLFSTFMILSIDRLQECGKYGMINMHSWMFLSSFERLRQTILEEQTIDSLLHLGARTFDELSGEVVQNAAYVVTKTKPINKVSTYFRLVDGKDCSDKEQIFLNAIYNHTNKVYFPNIPQDRFEIIPGSPIGYWVSHAIRETFTRNRALSAVANPCVGLQTADNARFLRSWFEVDCNRIYFGCPNAASAARNFSKKWYPCNKGGGQRKWYGNQSEVIDWQNNGERIKNFNGAVIRNEHTYFKPCIAWNMISSGFLSFRYFPQGFVLNNASNSYICDDLYGILGTLNSKYTSLIERIINPTINLSNGVVGRFPYIVVDSNDYRDIVKANINISQEDWDAHETSWNFKCNEIVRLANEAYESNPIDVVFVDKNGKLGSYPGPPRPSLHIKSLAEECMTYWVQKLLDLHANEEELNRQFIEIYGLQDELTPDVPLDEVTILQQGEISFEDGDIKWNNDVIIKQLISYAVGCWMGRYRLDKPGLHIAHTDATKEEIAPYEYNDEQFVIDDDGIIPLMSKDCMFPDNAALRIADFVRQVFGELTQVENLNFIEESLGMTLEQYFIKQFWKDHKKMYQNRPIYWLFSSKKDAFQCIAYMHRMDDYTVERVRQKYLLPHMDDLRKRIAELAERGASLNTQERKKLDTLRKELVECEEYHDRLHPVADRQIAFDLDDGVVVNYSKFGDVLAKLK